MQLGAVLLPSSPPNCDNLICMLTPVIFSVKYKTIFAFPGGQTKQCRLFDTFSWTYFRKVGSFPSFFIY